MSLKPLAFVCIEAMLMLWPQPLGNANICSSKTNHYFYPHELYLLLSITTPISVTSTMLVPYAPSFQIHLFGDWLPECVLAIQCYTWSPPGCRPPLLGMTLIPWQGTSRASWSISWHAPTTSPLAIIIAHPLGCNPTQTN